MSDKAGSPITRRRLLRLGAGSGLVLLSGGVAGFGGGRAPHLFRVSRAVMGTWATILLAHSSRDVADAALDAAFTKISQVERRMSRFRADSDVGRLNAHRNRWIAVAPGTATVLRTALEIATTSDGHFDPCLDRLISLWGFHDHHYPNRLPPVPDRPNPDRAFYRALTSRHDGQVQRFRLEPDSPGIDLGGIAKGYAIDQATDALRAYGVRHALVNVGDDLFALGTHPSGTPWQVGVRHPRQPGALLQVLTLGEQAVATSGDYANCFVRHGQRYTHLFDPHTGQPAQAHRSMTIVTPNAMQADALATAAFSMTPSRVSRFLTQTEVTTWLAVDAEGRQHGPLYVS